MFLKKLARLRFFHAQACKTEVSRRVAGLACSLLLVGSTGLAPAFALSLGQKKSNLQLPLNSKLDDGTESSTDSSSTTETTETTETTDTTSGASTSGDLAPAIDTSTAAAGPGADLSPMKLGDDEPVSSTPAEPADSGKSPTFKIRATEDNKLPNGTAAPEGLPSTSVKPGPKAEKAEKPKKDNKLGHSLSETARDVNALPLALIQDEEESKSKAEFLETSEQRQIAALWDATLNRSPDIQFVVQKLVPNSDKGHAATVMARALSGVLAGSISMAGMVSPTQGTYMAQNFSHQLLGQLMGVVERRDQKMAQLGQAELIALYDMVRRTSDKLVDNYRLYKKNVVTLNRATTDFEELNNMMKAARSGQDAAKQLEMEYTVRKAQRDVIGISDDIHRFRQGLVDMAGADAVGKLDVSVQDELQNLGESSSQTIAAPVPQPIDNATPALASPAPKAKDKTL